MKKTLGPRKKIVGVNLAWDKDKREGGTNSSSTPVGSNKARVDGGGGGGDDVGMEHRMTALETRLDTLLPTLATKADIGEIRADLHKVDAAIGKWMIATILGLFFGFAGLFFAASNFSKPASALQAQQPIIINVPSAMPSVSAPAAQPTVPPPKPTP